MARTLNVYLHRDLVGQLIQDDDGRMVFDYAPSWLDNPKAKPLSQSLPLRSGRFSQRECRGFFGGILPEDPNRKVIARILGISENNDFAMLAEIGGECAGAVTFLPPSTPLPDADENYRPLTDDLLAEILNELPRRPLMAGAQGVRLSLAGVQDKIAVRVEGDKISLPTGTAPTSHILKPAIATWEDVVFNEAFCMQLAQRIGLPTALTTTGRVKDIDYLLISRFDRDLDPDNHVRRLHQEDFCQALAVAPENKYQAEGGPGLADCFALIRAASTTPVIDLLRFLDAAIFNLVIANHDAHGKNFALLYHTDGSTRLAPLYDLVSTVVYPELTNQMAMKIGGQTRSDLVGPGDFDELAEAAGLSKPLVQRRVREQSITIMEALEAVDKGSPMAEQIANVVTARCQRLSQW